MGTSTGIGNTGDSENERRPERLASQETARAAALQVIREGTPTEVQQALADAEARGDIVRATDWDPACEEEFESESGLDGELSLEDEDDPCHEGWDEESVVSPEVAGRPVGDDDFQGGIEEGFSYELVVRDGTCRFDLPRWMRHRNGSSNNDTELDEVTRRCLLFEQISRWLNEHRREFLRLADPWYLGCEALAELRAGLASVSPQYFLVMTGLGDIAGNSLFSRNKDAAVISWEDGTLPLEFLFGNAARQAWVANAVCQFALENGQSIREKLGKYRNLTKPKESAKRRDLARTKVAHLGWPEFIARANDLAGTKWKAVLKSYEERMQAC